MELLKKYSAMFIPVGITLVAVILIVTTILLGGSLKKQMAASVAQHKSIQGLLDTVVPEKQWEVEKSYQDGHAVDADAVAAFTSRSSQRELLSYDMFPAPDANETSNTIFHNFAKSYSTSINALIARMKGGEPYTVNEMATLTRPAGTTVETMKKLTDQLCKQRAMSMLVYVSPLAFAGYDYGSYLSLSSRDKGLMECWFWQIAYWIQEDVADTIIAANASSKSALDAPVKRLLGISFQHPDSTTLARAARTITPGTMGVASPVYSGPTTELISLDPESPKYVRSVFDVFASAPLTARISNEEIDVVHFSFAVIIRASALMPFVKELSSQKAHTFKGFDGKAAPQKYAHNQMTILSCSAAPVDLIMDEAQYFRYGDDALYKVNFVCEYVFNRSGYDAIKPEIVKNPPEVGSSISE